MIEPFDESKEPITIDKKDGVTLKYDFSNYVDKINELVKTVNKQQTEITDIINQMMK